jgi:zinc and cadmium transporter
MKTSGWAVAHQNIVNFAFSMACPIGALLFYFGFTQFSDSSTLLGWGLAISGGFFICIALSDLLPEVAFHDHDRGILTAALLVGISLAVAIESLPGHTHDHQGHQPPFVQGK